MSTNTPTLAAQATDALRELLPPPFAWIAIPGGPITVEAPENSDQKAVVTVAPFALAQVPVTNAQYQAFIAAGGYNERRYWSRAGARAMDRYGWTPPPYADDPAWNQPDQPVAGVSWFEARAFCRWLGEALNQRLNGNPHPASPAGEGGAASELTVTLPTEFQRQRAAQGDDGREFPWGDEEPTDAHCNWRRAHDGTTPVMRFPAGASPYGVHDLSGNVWEWCLDLWQEDLGGGVIGSDKYALRGGCWSSDSPISLRAAHRSRKDPNTAQPPRMRDARHGFRVALRVDGDSRAG